MRDKATVAFAFGVIPTPTDIARWALARAALEILGESCVAKRLTGEVAEHVLEVNNRQFERLPTINDTEGHRVIVAMFEKALPA